MKPTLVWKVRGGTSEGFVNGSKSYAFCIEKCSECVWLHCFDSTSKHTKFVFKDVREAKKMAREKLAGKPIASTAKDPLEEMGTSFVQVMAEANELLSKLKKVSRNKSQQGS